MGGSAASGSRFSSPPDVPPVTPVSKVIVTAPLQLTITWSGTVPAASVPAGAFSFRQGISKASSNAFSWGGGTVMVIPCHADATVTDPTGKCSYHVPPGNLTNAAGLPVAAFSNF